MREGNLKDEGGEMKKKKGWYMNKESGEKNRLRGIESGGKKRKIEWIIKEIEIEIDWRLIENINEMGVDRIERIREENKIWEDDNIDRNMKMLDNKLYEKLKEDWGKKIKFWE